MIARKFEFDRSFLKYQNYKNRYHIYTDMETVSDKFGKVLPDSVIKLLYRIYTESVN